MNNNITNIKGNLNVNGNENESFSSHNMIWVVLTLITVKMIFLNTLHV